MLLNDTWINEVSSIQLSFKTFHLLRLVLPRSTLPGKRNAAFSKLFFSFILFYKNTFSIFHTFNLLSLFHSFVFFTKQDVDSFVFLML